MWPHIPRQYILDIEISEGQEYLGKDSIKEDLS